MTPRELPVSGLLAAWRLAHNDHDPLQTLNKWNGFCQGEVWQLAAAHCPGMVGKSPFGGSRAVQKVYPLATSGILTGTEDHSEQRSAKGSLFSI